MYSLVMRIRAQVSLGPLTVYGVRWLAHGHSIIRTVLSVSVLRKALGIMTRPKEEAGCKEEHTVTLQYTHLCENCMKIIILKQEYRMT